MPCERSRTAKFYRACLRHFPTVTRPFMLHRVIFDRSYVKLRRADWARQEVRHSQSFFKVKHHVLNLNHISHQNRQKKKKWFNYLAYWNVTQLWLVELKELFFVLTRWGPPTWTRGQPGYQNNDQRSSNDKSHWCSESHIQNLQSFFLLVALEEKSSSGFVLWTPRMSAQNVTVTHPLVVEIFHFAQKCWTHGPTDRRCRPKSHSVNVAERFEVEKSKRPGLTRVSHVI